jgi:hypothetical protein
VTQRKMGDLKMATNRRIMADIFGTPGYGRTDRPPSGGHLSRPAARVQGGKMSLKGRSS